MAGGRTSGKKIRILERRQKVIAMRRAGASFRAIASALSPDWPGYDQSLAFRDLQTCLDETVAQTTHDTEELRTLELERLDNWLLKLHSKIEQGDTRAISTAIQISDRRCKLLGLDAPVQIKIQEGVEQGLDTELRGFLDSLEGVLERETYLKVLQAISHLQESASVRN